MVFQQWARDFDHPRHSHLLQRLSIDTAYVVAYGVSTCFNIVGREILTIPDTPTTQGLSLWCFNIVSCTIVRRGSARTARGSDAGRVGLSVAGPVADACVAVGHLRQPGKVGMVQLFPV